MNLLELIAELRRLKVNISFTPDGRLLLTRTRPYEPGAKVVREDDVTNSLPEHIRLSCHLHEEALKDILAARKGSIA